jgi:hypothetical protein
VVERIRAGWAGLKGRWDELLKEFGVAALAVHYTIFFATWFGFWLAIKNGIAIEGVAADAGTVGGSCLATQATKPARLPLTLVVTPFVVGLYRRLRGQSAD